MFQGMKYVYEVYKERSFSKAAQNLYISQPSLSATIKKIEARLGTPIFDRSSTPLRLTECGQEYIKCVEKIMDIQNDFENYLGNMQELKAGKISIGASNLFASFILPPYISRFTRKYPQVKINLIEADTPLLEGKLADGSLDLIIDNHHFREDLYTGYPLCPDHLMLAVPLSLVPVEKLPEKGLKATDVLADKHLNHPWPSVSLCQFQDYPFLLLRSGNDTRTRADHICQHQGFLPNVILKLDQQATAYHLSCYGMGITFISDTLIKNVRPDPNMVFYPLTDPEASRTVAFYHKKGKYVTRAMAEFLAETCPAAAQIISS